MKYKKSIVKQSGFAMQATFQAGQVRFIQKWGLEWALRPFFIVSNTNFKTTECTIKGEHIFSTYGIWKVLKYRYIGQP